MITFTILCLLVALVFFIVTKNVNKKVRYSIIILLVIAPVILLLFLVVTGDKAPKNTPIIYQGPSMISKYAEELEYNRFIEKGKELEAKGMYDAAILEYEKALKVNRIALPSYYVLLDKANAQLISNNKDGCKESLIEFIRLAEIETNPSHTTNPQFIIINNTATRLSSLVSEINKAKNMLSVCSLSRTKGKE